MNVISVRTLLDGSNGFYAVALGVLFESRSCLIDFFITLFSMFQKIFQSTALDMQQKIFEINSKL